MIAWRAAWRSTPCVHCGIIRRYAHMVRGTAPSQALLGLYIYIYGGFLFNCCEYYQFPFSLEITCIIKIDGSQITAINPCLIVCIILQMIDQFLKS